MKAGQRKWKECTVFLTILWRLSLGSIAPFPTNNQREKNLATCLGSAAPEESSDLCRRVLKKKTRLLGSLGSKKKL